MNVLLFVTIMLMLLTMMTYARLETFRSSQGFQILFQNYMEEKERGYINEMAIDRYKITHISKGKTTAKERTPKVNASPRISLQYLLNEKERSAHPLEAAEYNQLLKKLIINLYGDQKFFKEMGEKRITFVDETIAAISRASAALDDEHKIKDTEELSNLNLGDPELNEILYKILHGAPSIEMPKPPEEKNVPELIFSPTKDTVEQDDDADGQALDKLESQEYKSPKGYYSILDYLTVAKIPKIRVYLASPNVLKAIFNDDNVVQQIINTRKELYQGINSDNNAKNQLSDTFKNMFLGKQDPVFDEKILDFTVSKTNPSKYE